jgi:hypothetical protein
MIVYKLGQSTKINLTSQMFMAKGGQAQVFGNGSTVYKVYLKKEEAIPLSKIQELQNLNRANILNPQIPLVNSKAELIGFTMKHINDTLPLCKLFTNEVWRRMSIDITTINQLVNSLRETTEFIHKNNCLIMDGNELNYLVDEKTLAIPYFIDVDSYLTPSFSHPSKVYIMPSIRDYHSPKISTQSDWFAFAVVTCQLFLGIHPFRGGHPDYKKTDLEGRMKNSVSIFNKEVSLPPPTRDFNLIPKQYHEWYIDMFEHNKRTPPPLDATSIIIIPVQVHIVAANNDFEIKLLNEYSEPILYHTTIFGMPIVKTTKTIHIGNTKYNVNKNVEFISTPISNIPLFVKIENGQLHIKAVKNSTVINSAISCTDMMISENILYVKYKENLMEIGFHEQNDTVRIVVKKTWQIMPNSSKIFSGVIYQSILGKAHIAVPKKDRCINYTVPELDEHTIISAKCDLDVCQIIGIKNGQYDKIILTLSGDKYTHRIIENISDTNINFVTLDNGIVISITDDYMEVFKKGASTITKIQNKQTNSTMVLCKDGTIVKFFTDNKLYSIKMKGGK